MYIDYDKETKTVKLNGAGSIILHKNEYGIKIDHPKDLEESDVGLEIRNFTIIGLWDAGLKNKLKILYRVWKFIK